jgi:hypothetical protein
MSEQVTVLPLWVGISQAQMLTHAVTFVIPWLLAAPMVARRMGHAEW